MRVLRRVHGAVLTAAFAAAATFGSAFAACKECGTVTEVKTIKRQGQGTGVGAVAGGVVGGVLGHQVGGGRGKDVATVAGAAGGAYVGHQVEKEQKSTYVYRVSVQLDGGTARHFDYRSPTSYKVGDAIKVVDNKLTRR